MWCALDGTRCLCVPGPLSPAFHIVSSECVQADGDDGRHECEHTSASSGSAAPSCILVTEVCTPATLGLTVLGYSTALVCWFLLVGSLPDRSCVHACTHSDSMHVWPERSPECAANLAGCHLRRTRGFACCWSADNSLCAHPCLRRGTAARTRGARRRNVPEQMRQAHLYFTCQCANTTVCKPHSPSWEPSNARSVAIVPHHKSIVA